jgi:putative transposase
VATVLKAHRLRLNPIPEQEQHFWQAAGIARSTWNWALGEYNRRKAEGLKVKIIGKGDTLKAEFCALKDEQFPWVGDVSTYVYQQAFADLQKAVSRYFKLKKEGKLIPPKDWRGRKDGKPFGWPQFKGRNKTTPSFYLANTAIRLIGDDQGCHWIRISRCPNLVNMVEALRFEGKVMGARVSYRHGHWWLSVQVETEHKPIEVLSGAVGVDLGIKHLAVTSDGSTQREYANPKALRSALRKLRRLQRKRDRQQRANNHDNYNEDGMVKRGVEWVVSNNMKKTDAAIRKLQYRIVCLRQEASHQLTSELATTYEVIAIEDLNVNGMLKNPRLAKDIADAAFYEKRRQLEYKASWNGGTVVVVDRWFPSSKMCNECGYVNAALRLSDRRWTCPECGTIHHRDGNSADNLRDEGLRLLNMSPDYLTETQNDLMLIQTLA